MIVHRDRKRLLCDFLADHILIEGAPDLHRFGHPDIGGLTACVFVELLVENALADVDAAVADIDARAGNQFTHLSVAFATERTHCEVGGAGHIWALYGAAFIPQLCVVKPPLPLLSPGPRPAGSPHPGASIPCGI